MTKLQSRGEVRPNPRLHTDTQPAALRLLVSRR